MALNDVLELAVIGSTAAGGELVNVYHYIQTTGVGDNPGVNLIDGWVANVSGDYADIIAPTVSITGFRVRNKTQPTFGTDYTLPSPILGTLTGHALPPQTAAVISWRTGLIGRRFRGRTYVWPATEDVQNEGQWGVGYVSALTAFGSSALTFTQAGFGYTLCVYSENSETPGVIATVVQSVVVDQYARSQRRRQVGVGS